MLLGLGLRPICSTTFGLRVGAVAAVLWPQAHLEHLWTTITFPFRKMDNIYNCEGVQAVGIFCKECFTCLLVMRPLKECTNLVSLFCSTLTYCMSLESVLYKRLPVECTLSLTTYWFWCMLLCVLLIDWPVVMNLLLVATSQYSQALNIPGWEEERDRRKERKRG